MKNTGYNEEDVRNLAKEALANWSKLKNVSKTEIHNTPVLIVPETCKEFHGQAYKPTVNKYFYGEYYECYICGKRLGSSNDYELKDINYCSRCGNEIDWTGIER